MDYFNSHENVVKEGKVKRKCLPFDANVTLCEGEFNRFYMRGTCLKAIEKGDNSVIAYRARHSNEPRPESVKIENTKLDVIQLLMDLRIYPGFEKALKLPPGPNSGMSVKLIDSK